METPKKPANEVELGRIRVAIWANQNDEQEVWFNVTASRSYRDEGTWKRSTSFRRDDLPILSKALDMAYVWIWKQHRVQVKAKA